MDSNCFINALSAMNKEIWGLEFNPTQTEDILNKLDNLRDKVQRCRRERELNELI
jgi:hypothetical protein